MKNNTREAIPKRLRQTGFEMNRATPPMWKVAKRLMADEVRENKSSKTKTPEAFYAGEKLRPHLTALMGEGGFLLLEARPRQLLCQLRFAVSERSSFIKNRGPASGDLLQQGRIFHYDRAPRAERNRPDDDRPHRSMR